MKILQWLGFAPTQEDKELIDLVKNSYKSVTVVGRGTVQIDAKEVYESKEFKEIVDKIHK